MNKYEDKVKKRSKSHYVIGWLVRFLYNLKYALFRYKARLGGAKIGQACVLNWKLARRANHNLFVGDHTSIASWNIDLRAPVKIGSHVVIGTDTKIITVSHDIDSEEWDTKYYGITIEDYCWIPNDIIILPQCRKIGRGAVVGTGSVVTKNLEEMIVYGGNPAKEIRKRGCVHSQLVVESLRGGDFQHYQSVRKG